MVLHSILQTGFKWQYEVNRDTTPKSEKEQDREEKKNRSNSYYLTELGYLHHERLLEVTPIVLLKR